MTTEKKPIYVEVDSPAKLLSIVPVLCGFNPANSLVVMGLVGPSGKVRVTLRYDLPEDSGIADDMAAHAMTVLMEQDIPALYAVIYGTSEAGAPVTTALLDAAATAGIRVKDVLRVADGHYWSYEGTPSRPWLGDGTPFEITINAEVGDLPVLASREAKAATVAPVTGEPATQMRQAIIRAGEKINAHPRRAIEVGLAATQDAITRYRDDNSQQLSDEEAATIITALASLRVRDDAWSRMIPEHSEAHLRLWTDLTRRAQAEFAAPVASLLAFVAWQSGDGALANVALDRALSADPKYSMAQLLRQAINAGAPPSMARLPMTPEEVAEGYK